MQLVQCKCNKNRQPWYLNNSVPKARLWVSVFSKKKGGGGFKKSFWRLSWWSVIKNPPADTGDTSLIQEDPTCCGAAKPMRHSYWACALEPGKCNCWAHVPRACAPHQEKPLQWETLAPQLESSLHSPQLEKTPCKNEQPAQPKINN